MANKQSYLGEFEHFVLLSILQLGDSAYGVTIRRQLREAIGRDVSLGALYSTIERLEKKGYVTSRKGEATPERGGKAKRIVTVTVVGIDMLKQTKSQLDVMWKNVDINGAFS